jgi:predicted branched-subunit amino acid permease
MPANDSNHHKKAFWDGVRDTLIVTPSYLPFAIVCGVAAVNAGLELTAALALAGFVYGGSSQAVLTQLLQGSASLFVAVLSGLVVNLRMAVYSAAMAPRVRHLSTPRRMLAAAFLVDNAFAFMEQRREKFPEENDSTLLHYYAGMSSVLWPAWIAFCALSGDSQHAAGCCSGGGRCGECAAVCPAAQAWDDCGLLARFARGLGN